MQTSRKLSDVALRFADDDDMLSFESQLDKGGGLGIHPRTDRNGNSVRDWSRFHQKAMNELSRRLRASKDTAEPMELGRLSIRSKENLREPAACLALFFLFSDIQQSTDSFLAEKAAHYWRLAGTMIDAESTQLDYDVDNSGNQDDMEKAMSFPARTIRG